MSRFISISWSHAFPKVHLQCLQLPPLHFPLRSHFGFPWDCSGPGTELWALPAQARLRRNYLWGSLGICVFPAFLNGAILQLKLGVESATVIFSKKHLNQVWKACFWRWRSDEGGFGNWFLGRLRDAVYKSRLSMPKGKHLPTPSKGYCTGKISVTLGHSFEGLGFLALNSEHICRSIVRHRFTKDCRSRAAEKTWIMEMSVWEVWVKLWASTLSTWFKCQRISVAFNLHEFLGGI